MTDITAGEYQHWVAHNWNWLGFEREPNPLRELFIMSVGLGGEAGEVQELLKKHVRDGREIVSDLRLELGDVLHYLTRIASEFGLTLEDVMASNMAKIEARHAKWMEKAHFITRVCALPHCQNMGTSACGALNCPKWPR